MPESAGFVPKLTLATPSRGCLPYIFPELLPLPLIVRGKDVRFWPLEERRQYLRRRGHD
jgi:hypothetical protein